ncbi:MAG: hypothetical protein DHS80DRAFT_17891 [Piptocephalis tieghemiana]|nr:MAG: hypothetical protein DHS80DRAFT_17891 [Piptocephalis tieghemiana]
MSRSPVALARKLGPSLPTSSHHPLLFLLTTHILLLGYALFVFTRGFLLSRTVLPDLSSCADSPVPGSWSSSSSPSPSSSSSSSVPPGCWSSQPPPYKRALILLVDALRFDFTLYDPSLPEPIPPYRNKLPIIQHLLDTQPRRALRYQFLADPPTTTLQRLKALSTGTLPTFIDAGSNFAGSSILEDSWLAQASLANRTTSFVGDDTWLSLFPEVFRESHPYPSLNVWDLHTVDEGVLTHLPSMLQSKKDTILLGHFLGVDHCGHRHGPSHPAMAAKLKQMNTILTDILSSIDNDTIVFVFGDHGMDGKGDHGGDSRSELEAGLFIYSGKDLDERGDDFNLLLRSMDEQVQELDFVPTLCMALGLPIPFGSLGSVIPEIFWSSNSPLSPSSPSHSSTSPNLVETMRINAFQISRYVRTYANLPGASNDLPDLVVQDLEKGLSEAEAAFQAGRYTDAYILYMAFTRAALSVCRDAWAKFDLSAMHIGWWAIGGALLGLGLLVFRSLFSGSLSPTRSLTWGPCMIQGTKYFLFLLLSGQALSLLPTQMQWSAWQELRIFDQLVLSFLGGLVLSYDIKSLSPSLVHSPYVLYANGIRSFVGFLILILHAILFASNSYLVHEDGVITALLQTQGLVELILILSLGLEKARKEELTLSTALSPALPSLLHMMLVRLISSVRECREEQQPGCISTFYASPGETHAGYLRLGGAILLGVLLSPWALARLERRSSKPAGSGSRRVHSPSLSLLLSLSMLSMSIYWVLEEAGVDSGAWEIFKLWGARSALVGCTLILPVVSYARMRAQGREHPDHSPNQGLGWVAALVGVVSVTLPPSGALILLSLLPHAYILKGIWSHQQGYPVLHSTKREGEDEEGAPFHRVVTLALLAQLYFFSTGHQATLPSIQWRAAFVGLRDINWALSPLFVLLNSMGPFLAWSMLLPLTLGKGSSKWDGTSRGKDKKLLGGKEASFKDTTGRPLRRMTKGILQWLLYWAVLLWSVSGWSMFFRRHLMVWKVWTPRFLLAAITFALAALSCLVLLVRALMMHATRNRMTKTEATAVVVGR